VVKRKIPSTRRESNPRTPIVQVVAQRYTDWVITALIYATVLQIGQMINTTTLHWTTRTINQLVKIHDSTESTGPLKRWYPTTTLHGVTTRKITTWNITAVKTSQLETRTYLFTIRKRIFWH
jgi:hypothetical protein